jgi:uncharacterized membrane protein
MHSHSDSRLQYDMVKIVSVLSYITIVGWLVALFLYGDQKSSFARFHLRQSLGLILTGAMLAFIPLIGWLLAIGVVFAWCLGLFHAINGQRKTLPIVGRFYQTHFDFIQ